MLLKKCLVPKCLIMINSMGCDLLIPDHKTSKLQNVIPIDNTLNVSYDLKYTN